MKGSDRGERGQRVLNRSGERKMAGLSKLIGQKGKPVLGRPGESDSLEFFPGLNIACAMRLPHVTQRSVCFIKVKDS